MQESSIAKLTREHAASQSLVKWTRDVCEEDNHRGWNYRQQRQIKQNRVVLLRSATNVSSEFWDVDGCDVFVAAAAWISVTSMQAMQILCQNGIRTRDLETKRSATFIWMKCCGTNHCACSDTTQQAVNVRFRQNAIPTK